MTTFVISKVPRSNAERSISDKIGGGTENPAQYIMTTDVEMMMRYVD